LTAPRPSIEVCRHIFVKGIVQGVGFRAAVLHKVRELDRQLKGWVRNRKDGDVEILIQGQKQPIDQLVTWLHAGGPEAGRVDAVLVTEAMPEEFLRRFGIRLA
jgi:acylphosphatase